MSRVRTLRQRLVLGPATEPTPTALAALAVTGILSLGMGERAMGAVDRGVRPGSIQKATTQPPLGD